jgi:hypothetical protein
MRPILFGGLAAVLLGSHLETRIEGPAQTPRAYGIASVDAATAAAVRKARAFIADEATLDGIRGFTIVSANPASRRDYRVLLPNRFRVDYSTGTTALDGATYWQVLPAGVPDTPGDGRRENFVRTMVGWCLNLLLRAPEAYPMTARQTGSVSAGELAGQGIELRTADGVVVHAIVLDRATGRMLGAFSRQRASTGEPYTLVERFEDYRSVAGVRVPMVIRQTRLHENASAEGPPISGAFRVGSISFNPPPAADTFKKSPGR